VSNEMFGIQARAGTCWYGQFNGLIVKSINGCSRENVVDRWSCYYNELPYCHVTITQFHYGGTRCLPCGKLVVLDLSLFSVPCCISI